MWEVGRGVRGEVGGEEGGRMCRSACSPKPSYTGSLRLSRVDNRPLRVSHAWTVSLAAYKTPLTAATCSVLLCDMPHLHHQGKGVLVVLGGEGGGGGGRGGGGRGGEGEGGGERK